MSAPPESEAVAREWLSLADEDLQSAQDLAKHGHRRQTCFLAQQSVEKSLKALLTLRQISFGRTHNIENLAALLVDAEKLGVLKPDVLDLSEYAVDARYPGFDANLLGEEDVKRALEAAREVHQSIQRAFNHAKRAKD